MDWNTENTKWYELPSCYENTVYRITKTGADPNGTSYIFFSIPDDIPDGCHIEVTLRSNNLNLRGNNNGDNIQVYDATIDGDGIHSGTNRYDNTGSNPNGWRRTNQNQPTPETISIGTSRGVIIYFTNNNNNNSSFEIEVGCKGCEPPHTGDDIIMNQASQEIAIECGKYYWFYDSGGATGNYNRNQNYTYTFTSTGQIYIRFYDFNTEATNDWMTIRDATANTVLANQQSGNGTLVDYVFNTEAAGNNMSIQWRSNNNNTNRSGWRAIIWAEGCPDPTCTTTPQFTNCPASLMSGQTWTPTWNTTATPTGWTASNASYSAGTVTAGATIGTATVSATVAENLPYCAGTMSCTFNVTCNNTNTLTVTSPIEVTVGGSSVDIDDYITANSSGGTPTFSTSSGNITLNTTTGVVTGVTAGDATVRVTVPQKTTGGITYCEKYVDVTIHVVEPGSDDCEGFETGNLHGWTSEGDGSWRVGVGDNNTGTGTHSGSYNALITHASNGYQTYLISPVMDLSGANGAILSFWYVNRSWSGDIDGLDVYYRINGGTWQGPIFSTTEAHSTWTEASVILPNLAANYQIGFMMTDNYGYGVGLDDICIKECTPSTATLEFSPDNGTVNIGNTIDLRSPTLTNTTGRPEQWSISGSGASFVAQGVVQGFDEGTVTITVSIPAWMDGSTLYCPMEATYSLEIIDPACDHTIILNENKSQTIECGETYCFYDSGGKTGNYSDNEDFTLTLTSTGTIHINFSEFETESASWDTLCIKGTDHDGKYGGTTIPSEFVSTGNQVVIHWQSDGSNTYSGWKATITATDCCTPRSGAVGFQFCKSSVQVESDKNFTLPVSGADGVSPMGTSTVIYNSSNTSVATVGSDGTVNTVGNGITTITATIAAETIEGTDYCPTVASYTLKVGDEQNCKQVGNESYYTTEYAPIYGWYDNSWVQMIYNKSNFEDYVGCSIKSITFFSNSEYTNERTTDIYIGTTTKDAFENNTDNLITGGTTAFSGNWHIYGGENTFVFDSPIPYENSDNIVIGLNCHGNYQRAYFYYSDYTANTVLYYYRDGETNQYDPSDMTDLTGYLDGNLPNIKVCFKCPVTPLPSVSVPETPLNACKGTAINTITVTTENGELSFSPALSTYGLSQSGSGPYSIDGTINTAGEHTITAIVTDSDGCKAQKDINITVNQLEATIEFGD